MGLFSALNYWKNFLKPDGFLVFSDCTWFTSFFQKSAGISWIPYILTCHLNPVPKK